MTRFAFAFSLLVAVSIPAFAHPPARLSVQGEAGVAEEVQAFRKRFADAVAARDANALRGFYAESFTHTHTTSKRDGKDARIVALLAGDPVIETAPVKDLKIHIHAGGWVAVALGTSPIKSSADGKVYAVHWTTTYARNGESWQLVASHATRGDEWKN